MCALITGMGGFIGSHLADFLLDKGFEVYGTFYKEKRHMPKEAHAIKCDVSKKKDVNNAVRTAKPDYIFHMAAQSFVVPSWRDPEATMKSNIIGTLNVLEALKNSDAVISIACSSAEYGRTYKNELPIKENKELRPSSPYAVSKVATDIVSHIYCNAYGMKIFRLRFFNIIGPRKQMDASSDFAKGIAEVEKGKKKYLDVGNLNGIRDFTDVRDAVRAIWLIAKKGKYGDVYNICSGKGYKMKDVLNMLVSMSTAQVKVRHSKEKMRITDDPVFVGDNSKLCRLGWKPEIPIERTMKDLVDYWRDEVR